jgi:hypothetical protein
VIQALALWHRGAFKLSPQVSRMATGKDPVLCRLLAKLAVREELRLIT